MKKKHLLPKFAIFLAAYNGIEYIFEQINSILTQENVDVHIFISIDKSSDGTESYLANLSSNESRITLLPLGDRFGCASVNFYRLIRDVNFADFHYICFSDQDDIWYPKKLYRAHDMLLKNKADGYSSNVIAFWVNGKRKFINKAQPQQPWDFLFESAGPGCTYVLNKQLALSFQRMVQCSQSEVLKIEYHDWLIYAFARANNFKWFIDSKPSLEYRQHKNNQVGVNIGWKSLWTRSKKTLNGHGFSQALLIANLLGLTSVNIVQYGLRGGRIGYLRLAFYARLCRRKSEDQLRFFILCLVSFFINPTV